MWTGNPNEDDSLIQNVLIKIETIENNQAIYKIRAIK